MHHNPAKNVLWVASPAGRSCLATWASIRCQAHRPARLGQDEDVCRALAASDAVRRQDGLRELERHVRLGLFAGGTSAGTWTTRASLRCARSTASSPRPGMTKRGLVARHRLLRSEGREALRSRPARRLRFHRARLPRCLRSHRRDQLFQLCADSIADEMIKPLRRHRPRRILRHRSRPGREAATGRALGTAQAVPGRADAGGQSERSDRVVATARVYQRSEVSRQGRRNAAKCSPEWPSSSASTPEPMESPRPGCRVHTRRWSSWAKTKTPTTLLKAATAALRR